jgi:hypothetical protein
MLGQLLSYVLGASSHIGPDAYQPESNRWDTHWIFLGSHVEIDDSAMIVPLEPPSTGLGSIALLSTHDFKITTSETNSP